MSLNTKYKTKNPLLEISKIKTRKETFSIIKSVFDNSDNNIIYGESDFENVKNQINESLDLGKRNYYKAFHKTIPELINPKDETKNSPNLMILFKIDYDEKLFSDENNFNDFPVTCLNYFEKNFDVKFAYISNEYIDNKKEFQTINIIATSVLKRSYYDKKIKDLIKKGMDEESIYGVLSFSLILPSSDIGKNGGKNIINSFQILQLDYYNNVLKKHNFKKRDQEPTAVKLTNSQAFAINDDMEKLNDEIIFLKAELAAKDSELEIVNKQLNKALDTKRLNNINELQLKELSRLEALNKEILSVAKNKGLTELNSVYRRFYKEDVILTPNQKDMELEKIKSSLLSINNEKEKFWKILWVLAQSNRDNWETIVNNINKDLLDKLVDKDKLLNLSKPNK